jgi:hypothetical protein
VCVGGNDGTATVTAAGNFAPFNVAWNTGDTTLGVSGLSAGSYLVTVTDANGCTTETLVDIEDPAPLSIQVQTTPITTAAAADGTASATINNGTAPYSYEWSNGNTTDTVTGLALGQYTVTITDGNGCQGTATFIIDISIGINNALLGNIKAYPNPFSGELMIVLPLQSNLETSIRIYHITGQLLDTYNLAGQTTIAVGGTLPAGIYFAEVMQGKERVVLRIVKTQD